MTHFNSGPRPFRSMGILTGKYKNPMCVHCILCVLGADRISGPVRDPADF